MHKYRNSLCEEQKTALNDTNLVHSLTAASKQLGIETSRGWCATYEKDIYGKLLADIDSFSRQGSSSVDSEQRIVVVVLSPDGEILDSM